MPWSVAAECIALGGQIVHSMRWSQIFAEIAIFAYLHLRSTPPLKGSPAEYCNYVWYRKTRKVWLHNGEKISKIYLFVLTESVNVTDKQTHRHHTTA